jgi:hypothetical protein
MFKYIRLCLSIILILVSIEGCAILDIARESNYNNPKPDRDQREKYVLAHPELDPRHCNLIENGIVGIGMSKEEVIASWGKPDRIERASKFGADEVWYYWDNWKFHPRVYFRNGIVVE